MNHIILYMVICLGMSAGCAGQDCSDTTALAAGLSSEQRVEHLKKWMNSQPGTSTAAQDVCPIVQIVERFPDDLTQLLLQGSEQDVSDMAQQTNEIVSKFRSDVSIRLAAGLGHVVGEIILRAVVTRNEDIAFRSGFLVAHLARALAKTGKAGWLAFESNLRTHLGGVPPMTETEVDNPWEQPKDRPRLLDLVRQSAVHAAKAHGIGKEEITRLLTQITLGRMKVLTPGEWQRTFGDPNWPEKLLGNSKPMSETPTP
jgi:hypothetical protein